MNIQRRKYEETIRERLRSNPIVSLVGPRQAGKTTLARMVAESGCTVVVMLPGSKSNLLVFHLAFQSGCQIHRDCLGRAEKAPVILITTMTGAFRCRSYSTGTIGMVSTVAPVCVITCRL